MGKKATTPDELFEEALSIEDRNWSAKTRKLTSQGPTKYDTIHVIKPQKGTPVASATKVSKPLGVSRTYAGTRTKA